MDLGGRNSVVDISGLVNDALASGEADRAYRAVLQLSNDLASASPAQLQGLVAEPPKPLPAGWDSFIAAVVEWHGLQAKIEPPRWVLGTVDPGKRPWSPPGAILKVRIEFVPWSFRRRNVLIEESELRST